MTTQSDPDVLDGEALAIRLQELVSYRYVGCRSVLVDREHAEGQMRLRRDMRTTAGLLTAPLAIASLDAAGNSMDRFYKIACTHISVDVFDTATDVDEVRVRSAVLREARTQLFTEARIEAANDPARVVAYATVDWKVLAPTPPGFVYSDPGPGIPDAPDLPPLWQAYEGTPQPGGGFVIEGLSPAIGTKMSQEPVLHHGSILVLTEAAALEAASARVGSDRLVVEHASTRIVAAGRRGPFVATAEVVESRDTITCRAEMHDKGANRLLAIALVRCRVP